MRLSGSKAAAVQCPFCPTALGGDEELQEHLLSVHVELQVQEQLSTSHTVRSYIREEVSKDLAASNIETYRMFRCEPDAK